MSNVFSSTSSYINAMLVFVYRVGMCTHMRMVFYLFHCQAQNQSLTINSDSFH